MYLKSPWRWPELWGMNLNDIKNPHLIFPGQVLVLEKDATTARLRLASTAEHSAMNDEPPTVHVSPKTRIASLVDSALPTLRAKDLEPFLAEPQIVGEAEYAAAPRIVATQEGRVLLTRGDRAYARGPSGKPVLDDQPAEKMFRVMQAAKALTDPDTGAVLGYEAKYAGKARLVHSETTSQEPDSSGDIKTAIVPASIDIVSADTEIKVGDRLLPPAARALQTYTPHAPTGEFSGSIVSVYGDALENASENQIVVLSKGEADGVDVGLVLAIHGHGIRFTDTQDKDRPLLKLPDERKGLLMVFRTFEHLSYALVLEITDAVHIGDRLTNPH